MTPLKTHEASGRFDFVLPNLVRLYRGDEARAKIQEVFGEVGRASSRAEESDKKTARRESRPTELAYRDIPSLCRTATLAKPSWAVTVHGFLP